MSTETVLLPDGQPFRFWDDQTVYSHTYHVAQQHPDADDGNSGSEDAPFLTINKAAEVLQPGEKVIVHEGVYRECVRPMRGGTAKDKMIWYQAAEDESVSVRGSQTFNNGFTPSVEFNSRQQSESGAAIWRRAFPAQWFTGYNPLIANNMTNEFTTFNDDWKTEEILVQQLRRVLVFAGGKQLKQVNFYYQLAQETGTFWVEDPGLAIHVRLWDDCDPNGIPFEITTNEQIFVPAQIGLGYIRVSGFTFEYCADGVPVPQHAMVSTYRGHHFIIENNVIRHANSTGIDIGNETWHASHKPDGEPRGRHILRNNHISDCGFCGIAGVGHVDGVLVEHNLIERIGMPNIERVWESAGLKMHTTVDLLIRRNVFRYINESAGIWLDYLNENSRITENVFHDIVALHPAIYMEVSHAWNMIDHNVLWQVRKPHLNDCYRYGYGTGIGADTGEKCIIANNFVGEIGNSFAISCDLVQAARIVNGRVGLCRDHKVFNNVIYNTEKRVLISRVENNECDGNLYSCRGLIDDAESFLVQYPAPQAVLNFLGWQEHFGFDHNGGRANILAEFDREALTLTITVNEEITCLSHPAKVPPGVLDDIGIGPMMIGKNFYRLDAGLEI